MTTRVSLALIVVSFLIVLAVVSGAVWANRSQVSRVCETVQRQMDRNEATVARGLHALENQEPGSPGYDYYLKHPAELEAAIERTRAELRTYQGSAC